MPHNQPYVFLPGVGGGQADEWMRMAVLAHSEGRWNDAERLFRDALRCDPQHIPSLCNIAVTYACGGDFNEALLAAERALLLGPSEGEAAGAMLTNQALIAIEAKRNDLAVSSAERAYEVFPHPTSQLALAFAYAAAGRPADAVPHYKQLLAKDPKHFPSGMNVCFAQTLLDANPAELNASHRAYIKAHTKPGYGPTHTPSFDRSLRVGYVSGDYKRHSAAFLFAAVVLHHTEAVEPFIYSTLPVAPGSDHYTKKFVDRIDSEHRRDVSKMKDEDIDSQIRQDRIDILVDLSGHTGGGKLPMFARKPAPIQITAWGFAHGTGVKEIDYFFADPIAVPETERKHYTERVWDLPCIVTFEPPDEYKLRGTSKAPCIINDHFTFGCFARHEKASDAYLDAVRRALLQVPESCILFKDEAYARPYCVRRVLNALDGIAKERILFMRGTSHVDHLLSYQTCDLMLDLFPHTAGSTCVEQLYMGVPIVTRYGTQPAGRTTASVLTCMNRRGWIAKNADEYVDLAVQLATARREEVIAARKTLRQELLDSPVRKGYVEAVEDAYRRMVIRKCATTK